MEMDNIKKLIDEFIDNFIIDDKFNIQYILTEDGKFISGTPFKRADELLLGVRVFLMTMVPTLTINIDDISSYLIEKGLVTKQKLSDDEDILITHKVYNILGLLNYINNPNVINNMRINFLEKHISDLNDTISSCESSINSINNTFRTFTVSIEDILTKNNNKVIKSEMALLADNYKKYVDTSSAAFAHIVRVESYDIKTKINNLIEASNGNNTEESSNTENSDDNEISDNSASENN